MFSLSPALLPAGWLGRHGRAALFNVCREGKAEVLPDLLAVDLSLNFEDADGDTPLDLAALNGHVHMVKALLKAGAEVDYVGPNGQGCTPLWLAAAAGSVSVASALLRASAAAWASATLDAVRAPPQRSGTPSRRAS